MIFLLASAERFSLPSSQWKSGEFRLGRSMSLSSSGAWRVASRADPLLPSAAMRMVIPSALAISFAGRKRKILTRL